MGLDITAYEGIAFAPPGQGLDEDGYADYSSGFSGAHINSDYPAHAADLPNPCVISGYRAIHSFRAGSYSGYGHWRESLAKLAGYPAQGNSRGALSHAEGAWAAAGGAFHELIDFSDCEGSIGPSVSAKLSQDFLEWRERALTFAKDNNDEYFMEVYEDFSKSFDMAAQGGAVCFH